MTQKTGFSFTASSMTAGTSLYSLIHSPIIYGTLDMAERSCYLPLLFEYLLGYDKLERHKHKKMDIQITVHITVDACTAN